MILYSFDHDSTWIRTVLGVILFIWLVVSQLKSEHSRIAFSLLVSSFIVNVWRIEEGEAVVRGSSARMSYKSAVPCRGRKERKVTVAPKMSLAREGREETTTSSSAAAEAGAMAAWSKEADQLACALLGF